MELLGAFVSNAMHSVRHVKDLPLPVLPATAEYYSIVNAYRHVPIAISIKQALAHNAQLPVLLV